MKRARLKEEQAAAYIGAEAVPNGGTPNGGTSVVTSDSQVPSAARHMKIMRLGFYLLVDGRA